MILPRLVIAAPQGRSGKTTLSIGLCAALTRRGLKVQPFKKGPDYIDPSWLTAAAQRACRNLDLFMLERETLLASFQRAASDADLAIIEGAMGLYDGLDLEGSGSTAQVARLLRAPVVLVISAARMTRSVAALVGGYQRFEPDTNLAGVILNDVAVGRHESMLTHAVHRYCGIPVLGCVPKDEKLLIPDRHLGLVPHSEDSDLAGAIERARQIVESYVDVEAVLEIARQAECLPPVVVEEPPSRRTFVRLGVIRDRAFSFYYPENLEALQRAGAELVYIDALSDPHLPYIDGLYIGGGFPEMFGEALESNISLRRDIAVAVDEELPVYAECAGLMYLAREIRRHDRIYHMVGALPADVEICSRPQGHGYVVAEVVGENTLFEIGQQLRGHEFHYSRLVNLSWVRSAYMMRRGRGVDGHMDGLVYKNVLASYTHLHALGVPQWAENFVALAHSPAISPDRR
ncbi:MAG: hydrogenobyrinic acid a,c-diamide synthase (glutamine-hydrolyzing) [Chloroflexi bacterium]|nr:hydrogenobyrinic acid a,c-diamide synthase (glutamine-hydrolyzing) [Chloroflexota bacterium]